MAQCWLALSCGNSANAIPLETGLAQRAAQPERAQLLRQRLRSLSRFMRYLKEPIARGANKEDGRTEHFRKGRFDSQALLDDPAVLCGMVYVDLNPVQADVVTVPEHGPHTSVRERVQAQDPIDQPPATLAAGIRSQLLRMTTGYYLELLDWSDRPLHPQKSGAISQHAPPMLKRLLPALANRADALPSVHLMLRCVQ